MITGVPAGVGAVYLQLNKENPICLNVVPGSDTNVGMTMHVGDTVPAIWQIRSPCTARTSLQHVSLSQVEPGSHLTNFWFSLGGYQVI
jgi:hypothetical protein